VRPTLTLSSLKTTSMSFCFSGRPACRMTVTSSSVWLHRTTKTYLTELHTEMLKQRRATLPKECRQGAHCLWHRPLNLTSDHGYIGNPLITWATTTVLIYQSRKDKRLSCNSWLTYSRQFTNKVVTCPAISRVQDRESLPVKTDF